MGIREQRGRSVVLFQSMSTTQNSSGEYLKTWVDYDKRRCKFAPEQIGESQDGVTQRRLTSVTVSVRYVPGLTSAMRAVIDGRTFQIESVTPVDGLKREQIVEMRELV